MLEREAQATNFLFFSPGPVGNPEIKNAGFPYPLSGLARLGSAAEGNVISILIFRYNFEKFKFKEVGYALSTEHIMRRQN